MKKITVRQVAFVGVLAALVFAASYLSIPIPTGIDKTRIHLGNSMCLLAGLLLGPVQGGLAAGIGSMFYDLADPEFITSAPFTLVFKFTMAFLCGLIAKSSGRPPVWRAVLGGIVGAASYVALYLGKSFVEHYWVFGYPLEAVFVTVGTKAATSSINGILAVVVAVPLFYSLRPLLKKARLL